LAKIAGALKVSMTELLAQPRADCQLIRKDELETKALDRGNVIVYSLLPDPIPGFELERLEIKSKGWRAGSPHLAGTKEYLYGLAGSITIYVAGENFTVNAGDIFAFPGDQAHSYRNHGEELAQAVSIVSLVPRPKRRTP
jgi:quercetin dioxygenase-like cupin family protein